jgi:hypothetical protein
MALHGQKETMTFQRQTSRHGPLRRKLLALALSACCLLGATPAWGASPALDEGRKLLEQSKPKEARPFLQRAVELEPHAQVYARELWQAERKK